MAKGKKSKTSGDRCKTKYPIVLIHGHGWRDGKLFSYWGRIPKTLESQGAEIYYGNQDAYGSIEENAKIIKRSVQKALKRSGSEKVNLIAHSKGGQEARRMISKLKMGAYVASLTTISTSHHGSRTMDFAFRFPKIFFKIAAVFVNFRFKMMGDKKPDFYQSSLEMTAKYCTKFNKRHPDAEDVYYQSYAPVMKYPISDPFMMLSYLVVKIFDGDNDGLVGEWSTKWGDFQGVLKGKYIRGISHADSCDLYRFNTPGLNVPQIYVGIVERLKKKGF